MRFGAALRARGSPRRIVELAVLAEKAGFDYVWLGDSQLLNYDCWPILALIAQATRRVRFGPLVTNPVTRHPTVVAAMLATLDDISNGRAVCGIGRGDSAPRMAGLRPATVDELGAAIAAIRSRAPRVEVWGAAIGPRSLELVGRTCDGLVMRGADLEVLRWALPHARSSRAEAGRPLRVMVSAPVEVGPAASISDQLRRLRWFPGGLAVHVRDVAASGGAASFPVAMREFAKGSAAYDYSTHGTACASSFDDVPDDMTQRLCLVGPAETHVARLRQLGAAGATGFTCYLYEEKTIETNIAAYGDRIIPALRDMSGR